MLRPLPLFRLLGAFALVAAGCVDLDQSQDEDPEEEVGDPCEQYKQSYCEYGADCGLLPTTAAECLGAIGAISCRSERLARDCDAILQRSSCVDAPPECDLMDVADGTEARAACDRVSSALCKRDESCGGQPEDACRLDLSLTLPCERAVALDGDEDACLEAIRVASCDVDGLPECDGLFVLL